MGSACFSGFLHLSHERTFFNVSVNIFHLCHIHSMYCKWQLRILVIIDLFFKYYPLYCPFWR